MGCSCQFVAPPRDRLISLAKCLLLGQLLSLLITGTGVSSQLLSTNGVNIPTSQSFLNYLLLGVIYVPVLMYQMGPGAFLQSLKARWWIYLILAVFDVEANFIIVLAYQYTSITSVMILDCISIPFVILWSRLFLKQRFRVWHVLAVALSVLGVGLLVLNDALLTKKSAAGPNPLLGDLLCVAGALLYSIGNVAQEACVEKFSWQEFLAMIGLFATPISAVQMAVLDRKALAAMTWDGPTIALLVSFALCAFLFYSLVPQLLLMSNATILNLSLLTSDVFAVVSSAIIFHYVPSALYFVALAIILLGIVSYNLVPAAAPQDADSSDKLIPSRDGVQEHE